MAVKPQHPIRRFDVFAEYQRQEQEAHGVASDRAKGYGLWIAKVVAMRRFGRRREGDRPAQTDSARDAEQHETTWHELDGQPQTDELFDAEIVWRMGADFYREVFEPAIRQARAKGRSYESIRDAIRRPWRPEAST
jgi:hypothetical protein